MRRTFTILIGLAVACAVGHQAHSQTAGELGIKMYAGLTITGTVGTVYSIEYAGDFSETAESDWHCLEFFQLPASPYVWADKSTPVTGKRFYRAMAMERPENMVFVPPGTFRMGSPPDEDGRTRNEGLQTSVIITRGFWMGKYPVTQKEYLDLMGKNPSWCNGVQNEGTQWERDYGTNLARPVETVSWLDAVAYCVALTEQERAAGRFPSGTAYRLPTEAEWEYACRAWTSSRFSYGDDPEYTNVTDYGWYKENSDGQTHSVGEKLPNPWGLYDMHGHVWEWCQDWWHPYLPGGTVIDPLMSDDIFGYRVSRGGVYHGEAKWCRSAHRIGLLRPHAMVPDFGFRVVLAPSLP